MRLPAERTPLLLAAVAAVTGAGAILLARAPAVRHAGEQAQRKFERLISDWVPTLLRKTSAHEGTYTSVQRNIDHQGVSYGILQWTQLGGGLYRVLSRMRAADPTTFDHLFGPGSGLGAGAADRMMAVVQAKSLAPVDGANLWDSPWLGAFRAAGAHPPFQNAQDREAATSEYMRAAVKIARLLGVRTERALVLFYNRTVHQGAEGALGPARVMAEWYAADPSRRPANPNDVLAQYAWRCAARFRRQSPPQDLAYNDRGLTWKPVTAELSELRTGDYRVRRVAVERPTWHVFSGDWKTSLYDLITKRSSDILLDRSLRDADVDLDAVEPEPDLVGALAPRV